MRRASYAALLHFARASRTGCLNGSFLIGSLKASEVF